MESKQKEIFEKAETALLRQLEVLTKDDEQPLNVELAIKSMPTLLDVIAKNR